MFHNISNSIENNIKDNKKKSTKDELTKSEKNKSPKKTSGYHYIRYLHKHAKTRSVDTPASSPSESVSSSLPPTRNSQFGSNSSDGRNSVFGHTNETNQLTLTRGQPEGNSQNKLNTIREVSKRHSIAVLPRDLSANRKEKTRRDGSHGRIKLPSNENIVVDITFDEHEPNLRNFRTPEKSPNVGNKSRDMDGNKLVNNICINEPIYEKLKGSSFDSSRATSVYDNALYMSMKNTTSPKDAAESQLVDLYQETDSIYSTPKIRISPDPNGTPTDMSENIYENMLYLPMNDVNRSVANRRSRQRRPLPPLPSSDHINHQIPQERVTLQAGRYPQEKRNASENQAKTVANCSQNSLHEALKEMREFKKYNATGANGVIVNSNSNYNCPTYTIRPPLPPPPSPQHEYIGHQIINNTTKDLLQENLIESLFATTSKINRTGIIRQSKIRQNARTESSVDEEDDDNSGGFFRGYLSDSSLTHNQCFSDNPDSGMSEGAATPVLSPTGGFPSSGSQDSLQYSPPHSDSLLGEPCSPLSLNDLQLNGSTEKSMEDLENDYFLQATSYNSLHENISHDITDPRYLSNMLQQKLLISNISEASINIRDKSKFDRTLFTPQQKRPQDISLMLHSAVGRNLFSEFSNISAITNYNNRTKFEETIVSPVRRHSISSLADISRRFSKINNNSNNVTTYFGETLQDSSSIELATVRRAFSMNSIACSGESPRNNSNLIPNTVEEGTKNNEQYNTEEIACRTSRRAGICHGQFVGVNHEWVVRGGAVTSLPGIQADISQWSKQSSRDHLSQQTPRNMTLKLPDSMQQQRATHMTGEEVSVPRQTSVREDVSVSARLQSEPACPPVRKGVEISAKLSDKQLQRQEESSYRLLRLFQDCPLDCIVESDDEEWDSGEWSLQATIDENSSRDPEILEISADSNSPNIVHHHNEAGINYSGIIVSPKVSEALESVYDDKMLARFRKSFRKKDKDKVEHKVGGIFMFVENPMYLSPEVKKEAKVISSMCGNNKWYFGNPTYSSPELSKNRVRTFTKAHTENNQCEKENIKNLRLAAEAPMSPRADTGNARLLQCNPCYDSPDNVKAGVQPLSHRRDNNYLEPINFNLATTTPTSPVKVSTKEVLEESLEKFIDHEYCTIPGDEESDSWVTQSSGSQQTDSPSFRRSASETDYRRKSNNSSNVVTPSRIWRENSSCKAQPIYSNEVMNTTQRSNDNESRQSVRTPRSVKRSSKIRDQVSVNNIFLLNLHCIYFLRIILSIII